MHKYTYANSGESSAGISFEKLSLLIEYMEHVLDGQDCFGFVFQGDEMILKFRSRDTGITWQPVMPPK